MVTIPEDKLLKELLVSVWNVEDVSKLTEKLENLSRDLSSLRKEVFDLKDKVGKLSTELDNLKKTKVPANLEEFNIKFAEFNRRISVLENKLKNLALPGAGQQILKQALDNLKMKIFNLEKGMTSLSTRITNLENKIGELEKRRKEVGNDSGSLAVAKEITLLKNEMNKLKENISEFDGQLKKLFDDVFFIKEKLENIKIENENSINLLNKRIKILEEEISEKTSEILAHVEEFEKLRSKIRGELEAFNEEIRKEVSSLKDEVSLKIKEEVVNSFEEAKNLYLKDLEEKFCKKDDFESFIQEFKNLKIENAIAQLNELENRLNNMEKAYNEFLDKFQKNIREVIKLSEDILSRYNKVLNVERKVDLYLKETEKLEHVINKVKDLKEQVKVIQKEIDSYGRIYKKLEDLIRLFNLQVSASVRKSTGMKEIKI